MGPAVRRWARWTAAAGCPAVAVVLLVGVAPGVAAAAEPGPGSVRVLQMNLCDSGDAGCYTGRSVAEAAAVIRAERPDAVTLNEVCRSDVAVLGRALAAGSGPATRTAFRPAGDRRTGGPVRCRNGQPYGIGVLTRLRGGSGGYVAAGGTYPVQDGRSPELRAWLCLHPRAGTGTDAPHGVSVCTTHLANDNPVVAGGQCSYLLGTVLPAIRTGSGGAPLVLGGDLNLATDGLPGLPGVHSCLPDDDRCVDDGVVQHVVATPELTPGAPRTVRLRQTDHPGLLVTLDVSRPRRAAG